jgi:hypothetical protein
MDFRVPQLLVKPSTVKRKVGRPRKKRRKKLTAAGLLESAAAVQADVTTFFEGPDLPMTITYRGPKVILPPFIRAYCHSLACSFTCLSNTYSPFTHPFKLDQVIHPAAAGVRYSSETYDPVNQTHPAAIQVPSAFHFSCSQCHINLDEFDVNLTQVLTVSSAVIILMNLS